MAKKMIKHFKLSDDNQVYIRFGGSSHYINAQALEVKKDKDNNINYLLLDKRIHQCKDAEFICDIDGQKRFTFNVSGPYVTELTRQH